MVLQSSYPQPLKAARGARILPSNGQPQPLANLRSRPPDGRRTFRSQRSPPAKTFKRDADARHQLLATAAAPQSCNHVKKMLSESKTQSKMALNFYTKSKLQIINYQQLMHSLFHT